MYVCTYVHIMLTANNKYNKIILEKQKKFNDLLSGKSSQTKLLLSYSHLYFTSVILDGCVHRSCVCVYLFKKLKQPIQTQSKQSLYNVVKMVR